MAGIFFTTAINASASPAAAILLLVVTSFCLSAPSLSATTAETESPSPTPWPHQFHSILVMNYSGELQLIDLWYDWPNGRNFNIIQKQLAGDILYDLEWNNGTSFFYTLHSHGHEKEECRSSQLQVGILRPNWLDGATYLGQRRVDGFLCNVWEKADFIVYYEDVVTHRPVHWVFYTGRAAHVMSFEVGAVLEDAKWQVPSYCFHDKKDVKPALDTQASYSDFNISFQHINYGAVRGSMQLCM